MDRDGQGDEALGLMTAGITLEAGGLQTTGAHDALVDGAVEVGGAQPCRARREWHVRGSNG